MDIREELDRQREVALQLRHCHLASYELLQQMVEHTCSMTFVWPDEGDFDTDGIFAFHEAHAHFEPLVIDFNTANMLILLHDALNLENQRKFENFINGDNRGRFGQLVEMGWERTTYSSGNSITK